MHRRPARIASLTFSTALTAALAACASQTPPPPPPPPLPLIVAATMPPVPVPPLGAAPGMFIPQPGLDGIRPTPNHGLSPDEALWHFRSAMNVAALNCQGASQASIVANYNRFLTLHGRTLDRANRAVDQSFKRRFPGANGLRVRDTHMTDVYNYFALPPTSGEFCTLMGKLSIAADATPDDQIKPFAIDALKQIDDLFLAFYADYDAYKRNYAGWQAIYARRGYVIVTGGPVSNSPPPPPARH